MILKVFFCMIHKLSFYKVIQWNLKQDFALNFIEAIWCQVVNKFRVLALGEKVAMSHGSWKQKPK